MNNLDRFFNDLEKKAAEDHINSQRSADNVKVDEIAQSSSDEFNKFYYFGFPRFKWWQKVRELYGCDHPKPLWPLQQ